MNALPLSFHAPVKTPATASEQKAIKSSATAEAVDFAQLLNAASAVPAETQPEAAVQQEELLAKLENLLSSLQKLPQENLTPEQQEMLQAIMQMMTQLLQSPEEKLPGTDTTPEDALPQSAVSEEPVRKELVLTSPVLEKLAGSSPEQAKLADVLEDAVELLQKLTTAAPVKTGEATGVPIDAEKLEQAFSQLINAIEQLETEQKKAETKAAVVQVQQLEQVLKQVTGLTQEPVNLVQPKEIQQPTAMPIVEASNQAKVVPEEVAVKTQESPAPTAPAEQSQPPAATGTEAAKTHPTPQRPEASVPQATVRMSNLVEELGEVLRGSFRLNGEGDSKQIKISIFPEHLGHMDIRLTSIDGKIVAQIFTSSLAAKEMLDQQASLLRSSMTQQGITVEKIEISQQSSQQSFGQHGAHPDQRSQQQKQGPSSRNRNSYQRIEEDAAAIVRRQSNDGLTMKVDYTI